MFNERLCILQMPADTLLTRCSAATLLMAPRPRLTHQRSGGDVSLPHLRKTTITSFGGLLSFTLYQVRLDFTLTAGPRDLSCPAALQRLDIEGSRSGTRTQSSVTRESSGMLLRPFKNIIISNLLLVGCRTGSLALVRPSITVLLGQAWRVYGSAKPLVCKSLLVLVCEILIQGCFVFFSVSLYSMICVRGAFPTPERTQYQTQDPTPCDQIFWVSPSFKLTKQVLRHSLQLRELAN